MLVVIIINEQVYYLLPPQGSILGPLLLLYVHDLYMTSNIIKPIMFVDNTNLFFSHKSIKELFKTMNQENQANKLSLNIFKKNTVFSTDSDNKIKKYHFNFQN